MICKYCNSEIPEGSAFCLSCGKSTAENNPAEIPAADPGAETTAAEPEVKIPAELVGQKIRLSSAKLTAFGWLHGRVVSIVTFEKDRLLFEVYPKRFMTMTELPYEDIKFVTTEKKIPFFQILSCIAIVTIPFVLLFGINTLITITAKDGRQIVVYENLGGRAKQFANTIQNLIDLYK